MSTQYATEPPPTATVLLHTTAGPLTISLFAQQTPLTCRNFLQHVLDGYYENSIFHRISPGFVIQTGDPTGTGEGGENIYADGDKSMERYSDNWARLLKLPEERYNERVVLGDELHSRLKFNRRGLVGMAKMIEKPDLNQYGSQFFITLADCRNELDGKCTMFGRIEGDGIYSVMKIAEGELLEDTERPLYPEKILKAEVVEMPSGPAWDELHMRNKIAQRTTEDRSAPKKKVQKKKGKSMLTFGGDDEDESIELPIKSKTKFNPALVNEENATGELTKGGTKPQASKASNKRKSPEPVRSVEMKEPDPKRRKPSFHDPTTQLPLRDPESPSRSPPPDLPNRGPAPTKSATELEAEIYALKSSMKRGDGITQESKTKVSALEALIPKTSTRGRKRPKPGTTSKDDDKALKMLDDFRARLENSAKTNKSNSKPGPTSDATENENKGLDAPDEEAALCDLHFIANCQSCSTWTDEIVKENDNDDGTAFLGHSLTFEKDRLGKDLNWKKKNEEELLVIDPREREKELGIKSRGDRKDVRRNGDVHNQRHNFRTR